MQAHIRGCTLVLILCHKNDNAYKAFLLANRAMFMQRIHVRCGRYVENQRDRYPEMKKLPTDFLNMDYSQESDVIANGGPFQIAFY